mgnify:CR=1 FL=1|tara:strand:+ start:1083 stop:1811 length:729 start_codon:yes stop_codon:yes gene_type:complete
MLKINIKNLKFILLTLFITLLFLNNFFNNFKNIYLNNFEKRINKIYGFCEGESIGYLIYLKQNFKLDNNPKIINYQHTPGVNWAIFDPKKINLKSKNIIFLNYPGKDIELNYIKELKNILKINNLSFYKDKIDKIDSIIISFIENNVQDDIEINLYSELNYGKRNLLNKFKKKLKTTDHKVIFNIDLEIGKIYPQNNNIAFEIKNVNYKKIKNIKILAKNKYIINNYNLINNYKKCFLIEKK